LGQQEIQRQVLMMLDHRGNKVGSRGRLQDAWTRLENTCCG
jgi:hypothetical protein